MAERLRSVPPSVSATACGGGPRHSRVSCNYPSLISSSVGGVRDCGDRALRRGGKHGEKLLSGRSNTRTRRPAQVSATNSDAPALTGHRSRQARNCFMAIYFTASDPALRAAQLPSAVDTRGAAPSPATAPKLPVVLLPLSWNMPATS